MPSGWLSPIGDRLESRVSLRIPSQVLPGCIQRVPPNQNAEEDEERIAFIMSQGIFCYTKMPFGLKNIEATYQRLVDRTFQKQIGRNLEVYVDDLVIKSHTKEEIIRDIAETFKRFGQINHEAKSKKSTFGNEGKGYFCQNQLKITAFLQNPEEVHKEERFPMESRSRSSLQTDEETHRGSPNADRTKGKGGANHVLSRGQGSYQCSLNDRKGGQANASILCEPRPTRARDQLHPHEKTGVSLAQRKQEAEKILPGTHNCCNHRSADKATAVKLRNHQKDAKV
ncbi:reverse transcriptase domain-containing protein [Tanacetum coccineum]